MTCRRLGLRAGQFRGLRATRRSPPPSPQFSPSQPSSSPASAAAHRLLLPTTQQLRQSPVLFGPGGLLDSGFRGAALSGGRRGTGANRGLVCVAVGGLLVGDELRQSVFDPSVPRSVHPLVLGGQVPSVFRCSGRAVRQVALFRCSAVGLFGGARAARALTADLASVALEAQSRQGSSFILVHSSQVDPSLGPLVGWLSCPIRPSCPRALPVTRAHCWFAH